MEDRPKPYTPETLAERWECSPATVRNMIRRGKLAAFRVGNMFRIPREEVEKYEDCSRHPHVQPTSIAAEQATSAESVGDTIRRTVRRERLLKAMAQSVQTGNGEPSGDKKARRSGSQLRQV